MSRRRVVRIPASSANLGPGFDVLAAALALHLEIEVAETGRFAVHTNLDVRTDRENLVARAFAQLHPIDDFEFTIRSQIPLSGGLGSSAAAVVGGLLAADHMFELDADVLGLATAIEGHADNVAAALSGGFVICDGHCISRLEAPDSLEAILVIPDAPVATSRARAILPSAVPISDVTFNLASCARLVLGLERGDVELIASGLADRLHQPYRAHLYPRSAALLELVAGMGALGATISGAGPTVLVWTIVGDTGRVFDALVDHAAGWAQVVRAPFEASGAYVTDVR